MTSTIHSWWYLPQDSPAQGPHTLEEILSLFRKGRIDGLTKLSTDPQLPHDEWKPLWEYEQLREKVRNLATEKIEQEPTEDGTSQIEPKLTDEKSENHVAEANIPNGISNTTPDEPNNHHLDPAQEQALKRERKKQSRKRARENKRLRQMESTSIYISGLPSDTTQSELALYFSKCGIIVPHAETGQPRVKIYTSPEGKVKGDALITYAKEESVENAIELLDGAFFRPQVRLKVERAKFENKKMEVKEGVKRRKGYRSRDLVEAALSWGEEKGGGRIVILKNVFQIADVDYEMVQTDMEEGCAEIGRVEKVTVFKGNREGVVAVKFEEWEHCIECVKVMNGRWYDERQLEAMLYDGVTDYRHRETDEERQKRDQQWQEWLEKEEDQNNGDVEAEE